MRFTKEDIYVRRSNYWLINFWFLISVPVGPLCTLLDLSLDVRHIILEALAVFVVLLCLTRSRKCIEIHGEKVSYRNYGWHKTYFSIYEIKRIEPCKEKRKKIIVYGKNGKELASFKEGMEEARIALYYLESKGVPLEESLQYGFSYEEYYEKCCKMARSIAYTFMEDLEEIRSMGFGRKRTKFLIKQEKSKRKEAEKLSKQALSYWELKCPKLKDTKVAMEWYLGKNYQLRAVEEKEEAIRVAGLRGHCIQNQIPVGRVLSTREGSPYVLQDNWFIEIRERLPYLMELTCYVKEEEKAGRIFFEIGADVAKYQNILLENPDLIKSEDVIEQKEYRVKKAFMNKKSPLSEVQWEQLRLEVDAACKSVKKEWVPVVDISSIQTDKEKIFFTEGLLEASMEHEVSIWPVCNYMAAVAGHCHWVREKLSNECWNTYVKKMIAGYESVRPLSNEEKRCIPSLLHLAVALQTVEAEYDKKAIERLMALYQFIELIK